MKKLLTIILLSTVMCSCAQTAENKKPLEKPFIITGKSGNIVNTVYSYQDKNGTEKHFTDTNDKYNVGDTLN